MVIYVQNLDSVLQDCYMSALSHVIYGSRDYYFSGVNSVLIIL